MRRTVRAADCLHDSPSVRIGIVERGDESTLKLWRRTDQVRDGSW
jgi:hypothetical protein